MSGEGHVLSSLSSMDAIYSIFKYVLRPKKVKSGYPYKDKFILSKGHAALGLYVVLEEVGILKKGELDNFCQPGSIFGGHPDATKIEIAIASTGSLGHGFPISAGLAYGELLQKNDSRVFCLIGDGESMEGTIWETLNIINTLKIHNVTLLLDFNDSHPMNASKEQFFNIFGSFDWKVTTVDGHDIDLISKTLKSHNNMPHLVILETTRGKGISLFEGKAEWHHRTLTNNDLMEIRKELFS